MKTNTLNARSLFPAILLLILAGLTGSVTIAQSSHSSISKKRVTTEDTKVKKRKTIEIEDVNGKKVVTVTTVENGTETVVIYKGAEAEKFLEQQESVIESDHLSLEDVQDMEFSFNVEGMEEGDSRQMVIIKESNSGNQSHHSFSMDDVDIQVTDGNDGKPLKVEMRYTDESGKKVEKTMVIDQTEIAKTMEDVKDILEDMHINIDMDIEFDDDSDGKVKTVVVQKKIIVDDEDETSESKENSEMFSSFSLSPNPSKGVIKLNFEPSNSGKIEINVTGIEGNLFFSDSYNGKGKYSKTIQLNNYTGVVILTIRQGDDVDIRKLIMN